MVEDVEDNVIPSYSFHTLQYWERLRLMTDSPIACAIDFLDKAAELLSKPGNWTKGEFRRVKTVYVPTVRDVYSSGSRFVGYTAIHLSFCAIGALQHVGADLAFVDELICTAIGEALGWCGDGTAVDVSAIVKWNDAPATTQSDVIKALKGASKILRDVSLLDVDVSSIWTSEELWLAIRMTRERRLDGSPILWTFIGDVAKEELCKPTEERLLEPSSEVRVRELEDA